MQGLVLNRYKQGETSLLLKVLTDELGLISTYVRGGLKRKEIPEIGDLLELQPRRRGNEGLFSLYQFDTLKKYPFFDSLELQTFRDIVFETLWVTLHEEHPEKTLLPLTLKCLDYFESNSGSLECGYFGLWLWLYRYTELLGLNHDFLSCSKCGKEEVVTRFAPSGEGIFCASCGHSLPVFNPTLVLLLLGNKTVASLTEIDSVERFHFTRSMVQYITKNLVPHRELSSLTFLSSLL